MKKGKGKKSTFRSLTGTFTSLKMQKTIPWESALMRDLIYLLEYDPDVISFERAKKIRYVKKSTT